MKSVLVMALGNVLTGDDGLGPCVLEELDATYDFPENVRLFDVGTPGIDLTMWLDAVDALIVIDALSANGSPGETRSYTREQIRRGALPTVLSPHDPSLKEALLRLEFLGCGPSEVLLVGAITGTVETGAPMTPAVRTSFPELERRVVDELTRLGSPPTRKAAPRVPDFWWEHGGAPAEAR